MPNAQKRNRAAVSVAKPPESVPEAEPVHSVRRDDILRAARELFFARGFDGTSMRDLADRIGFTQAALYYHFRNKDSILFELIEAFTDKLHAALEKALTSSEDPLEGLRRAIHAQILLSRDHSHEMKLVFEDKKSLGGEYADRIREKEIGIYRLYRDRVDELIEAGVLKPISPSALTFTLLAPVNFIYQWRDPDGPLSLKEIADQTLDVLMNGCVVRGAVRPGARARRQKP